MKRIIAGIGVFALSLTMTPSAFAVTGSDTQSVTATVAETLNVACAASVDVDGGTPIVPGSVESNTTTCVVTTNDADGYHLQIREDTQLIHTDATTTIPNKTAWNGSNAAAYTGTGLGFRVSNNDTGAMNTTDWGAATSCTGSGGTELYAGLPSSLVDILEEDDYNAGDSTTTICYALDVGTTQKAGEYTGQVTYSVTTGA